MIYKCGHCNFIGHCYGIPTSAKCGVSAPFCSRCGKNDKLKKVNPPNKSLNLTGGKASPVRLAKRYKEFCIGGKMPTLPYMCSTIAKAKIFPLRDNPAPTGKEILDNFHKCGDWPIIPILYEKAKKILNKRNL